MAHDFFSLNNNAKKNKLPMNDKVSNFLKLISFLLLQTLQTTLLKCFEAQYHQLEKHLLFEDKT